MTRGQGTGIVKWPLKEKLPNSQSVLLILNIDLWWNPSTASLIILNPSVKRSSYDETSPTTLQFRLNSIFLNPSIWFCFPFKVSTGFTKWIRVRICIGHLLIKRKIPFTLSKETIPQLLLFSVRICEKSTKKLEIALAWHLWHLFMRNCYQCINSWH